MVDLRSLISTCTQIQFQDDMRVCVLSMSDGRGKRQTRELVDFLDIATGTWGWPPVNKLTMSRTGRRTRPDRPWLQPPTVT